MADEPLRPTPTPIWKTTYRFLRESGRSFSRIGGTQHAAAFAFYAFFSLFPIVTLFVAIGSLWVDRDEAAAWTIQSVEQVLPITEEHRAKLTTAFDKILSGGKPAGIIAVAFLLWSSSRFFKALIFSLNRAWGIRKRLSWKVPLQYFALMAILACGFFVGFFMPAALRALKSWIVPFLHVGPEIYRWTIFFSSTAILFGCLLLFYKIAPRTKVNARDIWLPSLATALSLVLFQRIFIWAVGAILGPFNPLYEVLGVLMALLYGTYFGGVIIIFGGCACAVKAGRRPVQIVDNQDP